MDAKTGLQSPAPSLQGAVPLKPKRLKGLQRQEQAVRRGHEGPEPITLIEFTGSVVFCIDDDGVNANDLARFDDPVDCVEQQHLAEPLPLVATIHCKPPDDSRWHRIVWQPLGQRFRQCILLKARCTQGIVTGELFGLFGYRDEDLRDPPPSVLRGLLANVSVERGLSAEKRGAVVMGAEGLDPQWYFIH